MSDKNIYRRQFRLNLAKNSHKKVYHILNETERSGNQLIVDAILYYYEHKMEKDTFCDKRIICEPNETKNSDVVEPNYGYLDDE